MNQAGYFEARRISPTALGTAIVIEGALIFAAVTWQIDVVPPFRPTDTDATFITLPKPKDPDDPKPKSASKPSVRTERTFDVPVTEFQLPPLTDKPIEGSETAKDPVGEVIGTGPVGPVIPDPPTIQPAKARGNIQNLISNDDYPELARRREEAGTVRARLEIGAAGTVTGCSVVASSGSAALDSATCRLLKARARFTPAKDQTGQAVTDSYVTPKIIWRLEG